MLERNVSYFFFGKDFLIDDFRFVIIEHSVCVQGASEHFERIVCWDDCIDAAYPPVSCKRSVHLHVYFSELFMLFVIPT